jgi:hypothetical protein
MRIGTLKQSQRNRVNFKTWIKDYWPKGVVKELEIIRIFLPGRFNNFTLICIDDDNGIEVSRTLSAELGKQLIKNFKLSTKMPRHGTLYLRIDNEGNQEIIDKKDESKVYVFENNSFVLKDVDELPIVEEDIPF